MPYRGFEETYIGIYNNHRLSMPKQKRDKKADINFFAIYEVCLSQAVQSNAFPKVEVDADPLAHAQLHFSQILAESPLHLVKVTKKQKRKGEAAPQEDCTRLLNDILAARDHVYLLRINNEKSKFITQQDGVEADGKTRYEEKKVQTLPYCYVVIDNRPAKQAGSGIMLAIQKNSAFGDPKNVCPILEDYFNRALNEYGLQACISQCTNSSVMWNFCRRMCDDGDTIKRISFVLPNQKKVALPTRVPKENNVGIIKQMSKLAEQTGAIKSLIQYYYEDVEPDLLEKHAQDFVNVFRICKSQDYQLTVDFKNYGPYRCDEQVKVILPMEERLLNAFRYGEAQIELDDQQKMALYDWCDEVRKKCKEYGIISQTPPKRHR